MAETTEIEGVGGTTHPSTAIHDDWNDRLPKPVTSLADDVAKAGNTPDKTAYRPDFVETSAGAVAPDSDTAKAAADVAMKAPKDNGSETGTAASDETVEPDTNGGTPVAEGEEPKRVSRTRAQSS